MEASESPLIPGHIVLYQKTKKNTFELPDPEIEPGAECGH